MPAEPAVTIEVTAGPLQGKALHYSEHDLLLFGRAEECHVRLPEDDPTTSRRHFLLEVNPPAAQLQDLGSLNGTHINGSCTYPATSGDEG